MNKSERYTALLLILAGIAVTYYSYHDLQLGQIIAPDAGFMPFIVGLGLTILGAIWILTGKKVAAETDEASKFFAKLWYKPAIAVGLMFVYAWAIEAWGYILSTLVFMLAWQIVIEREKWFKTLCISTLGTAAMYFLFSYLLKVPVPKEFFMR